MPITATFDVKCTTDQYDEVMKDLEAAGATHPDGRMYHVAAAGGSGVIVVDVWASPAQLETFAQTLVPTLEKNGIDPPPPDVRPAHNIVVPS